MSYFQNKVVVVTGGSDGIGKALVEALLAKGARVATCGRSHDKLYALELKNAGKPLQVVTADVTKPENCEHFISSVIETYGTIHILINNAGISMRALFKDVQFETLHRLMDVNFWGTVYCTKYALDEIIKNNGDIIGITSPAGFRGLPGRSGYSASKFAMNGFLEALRTELLHYKVNVMWVSPGFTASNIRNIALDENARPQKENPMNEDTMMTAEQCAAIILNAIEKKKRSIVMTWLGKQAVFMNRLFPALTDKLVKKFYFKNGELIK